MNVHTKMKYAVKVFHDTFSEGAIENIEQEERLCRKLNHSNIVWLHDSIQEGSSYYLIFELMSGGDLFDNILARGFYSEEDASCCIRQILKGIEYCHENNIVHRDLKPSNILLENKTKGAKVKIADFGLAIEVQGEEKNYYGFAGTDEYLSPEMVLGKLYGKPVDIWACGVILYMLLVGFLPFCNEDKCSLYRQIAVGNYVFESPIWKHITRDVKWLIIRMLNVDQENRITVSEALQDPWICQKCIASSLHRQEIVECLKIVIARRKLKAIRTYCFYFSWAREYSISKRKSYM